MNIEVILLIVLFHFINDFIFQSEDWAINKNNSLIHLLKHTIVYSLLWFIPIIFILSIEKTIIFVIVTFILHTTTDFFTSKIVSKLFKENKLGSSIPNIGAFTMIGLDQLLHY